jgi:hydrogenase nickel incorporation protein HypB
MVHHALHGLPWQDLDYLFIENVGNLVCPAVYDLGQAANVVVLAVTEGEDKPIKYPVIFHKADLVLISKIDLLPHLPEISVERIVDSLRHVMPEPKYIAVSARTGQGIQEWIEWLREQEALVPSPAVHLHHHHGHTHV